MKKLLLFLGVLGLMLPGLVFAGGFRNEQNLGQNESIEGNLYLTGGSPLMSGTVKGDLGILGGNPLMNGVVEQDVFAAGGNVNIMGRIGGDLRTFGGNIFIDGEIDGEVLAYGGSVQIGANAKIKGDLNTSGGNVTVDPGAKILGKQNITRGSDQDDQKNSPDKTEEAGLRSDFFSGFFWFGKIMSLLAVLLVAVIIFSLYPKFSQEVSALGSAKKEFWPNFGLGLLIFIVTPIAAILSFVTGVGLLLGFILLISYVGLILMSIVFGGFLAGAILYGLFKKPKKIQLGWGWLIGGVIVLHLINMIPVVGLLVSMVFLFLACGTLVRTKWKLLR